MITTNRTDKQERFIQLRAQGKSYSDISAELGISKGSCSNWGKRYATEIQAAVDAANKKKLPPPESSIAALKERYKRGELSSQDKEDIEKINIFALDVGNALISAGKTMGKIIENSKPLFQKIGEVLEELFTPLPPEEQKKIQDAITNYLENLSPEERAELETEFNIKKKKTQKAALAPAFDKMFLTIYQGAGVNQLLNINTTTNKPKIDTITGNAHVKIGENFTLMIRNYAREKQEYKISTSKLLHACSAQLADQNTYREQNENKIKAQVIISIDNYLELLGKSKSKSDRDNLTKTIRTDINTLMSSTIKWVEKQKGQKEKKSSELETPILGGWSGVTRDGNIIITFSPSMAKYLVNSYTMNKFNRNLFKTNDRFRSAYPLGYYLCLHAGMDNNIKKGTEHIVTVESALNHCPSIASYAAVMKQDRNTDKHIRQPLENTLDHLQDIGVLSRWEYCNAKGVPLKAEQLGDNSYIAFSRWRIYFELLNEPDQTQRLQVKAEKANKRKTRRSAKKAPDSGNTPDTKT